MADAGATPEAPLYRWRFGSCEFDESRLTLHVAGVPATIEHKPLQVLALLLRHAGEVVTKHELFDAVWAGRVTVDHVLATAVGKLRRAIGDGAGVEIRTVPRIGYRLSGPVERIAAGRRLASELALAAGQRVPSREHFRLERQLGRTAGNEIWLARHDKTGERRVYKFALDGERLAALKREATLSRVLRQGLGERDDLVGVIDWNFHAEPFFLECAYAGRNLIDWAADEPALSRWSTGERVAFFVRIAQAVAAAHGVGVLHKDLKPANVLVEADGAGGWRVRLTDFGSGRLLDPDRLAALGITALGLTLSANDLAADARSGTLAYLAPELFDGRTPTVQSDVYALGILLYQLLVGDLRRPLAPGWERDIDDPLLAADIALATDGAPERRLGSVSELVDRLRRLDTRRAERQRVEAAEARARDAVAALDRARARRPWIGIALAVLAIGFALSAWLYRAADRARLDAERESARSAAIQAFLNDDVLGGANPELAGMPGETSIADLIDRASVGLAGRFADAPLTEAGVHEALARTYRGLARHQSALDHLAHAEALYAAQRGRTDPASLRARYAQVPLLAVLGRPEDAAAVLDAADRDAGVLLDAGDETALQAALARGAYHLYRLQAEPMHAAFAIADRLQRSVAPQDAALARHIRTSLADAELRLGRAADAERRVRALREDPLLAASRSGRVHAAADHLLLSRILRQQGRHAEALSEARDGLAAYEATLGPDHRTTLVALSTVASIHAELEQCAPALQAAREVVERMRRAGPDDSPTLLIEVGNLGYKEYYCGETVQGLAHVRDAERRLRERYGAAHGAAQNFRFFLAQALTQSGDHAAALAQLDGLSPDALQAGGGGAGWRERLDATRGVVLARLGRRAEGVALLQASRDALERSGADRAMLEEIGELLAEAQRD